MKKILMFMLLCGVLLPALAFASFDTSLRLGSRGSAVVELQNFLQNRGYYTGSIDGNYGSSVRAAVINFQIANGLHADGSFGISTRARANTLNIGLPTVVNNQNGCVGNNAYSYTTGERCNVNSNLPAGCTSTVGYSSTTGVRCSVADTMGIATAYLNANDKGAITINSGDRVKLSYGATNVAYCAGPIGVNYGDSNTHALSGSNVIYPTDTITYTINCYQRITGDNYQAPAISTSTTINVNKTNTATSNCSSAGYDTRTGYKCGCTSNSGYSTTTGESCYVSQFDDSVPEVNLRVNGSHGIVAIPSAATPITLSWWTSGGSNYSCSTSQGFVGWNGSQSKSGSKTLVPADSTSTASGSPSTGIEYMLTCTNSSNGLSATDSVDVTFNSTTTTTNVGPNVYFQANGKDNTSIDAGQPVTLSWGANGASYCYGSPWYTGNMTGSTVVYPTQTTSYSIVCMSSNQLSTVKTVNVNVNSQTSSDDPYGINYSKTSPTRVSGAEKTVSYQYPSNACGSLMSNSTPGSIAVGRGPVYNLALSQCSGALPDDSSFRTYACNNSYSTSTGSIVGNATFAFRCMAPTVTVTLLGDVNLDGVVNIIDAQQISRYLAGETTLSAQQLANADVSKDGQVTSSDVELISKFTVGIITHF